MGACSPDSRDVGVPVVATQENPKPVVIEENGYRIARGSTRIQDMNAHYDAKTRSMALRGKIEFLSEKGVVETHAIDLSGVLSEDGFINLKSQRRDHSQTDKVRIAAKATCLSEEGTCHSSFIDIYVHVDGLVYHHQVESHQKEDATTESDKKEGDKKPVAESKDEDSESEGGSDEVDGEPGQYVGSIAEDIEELLQVFARKDQPKKEEPKKEEPKKEEPKKEEPNKSEQPKKDPPKSSSSKLSQAIGAVNSGRLENAVNMLIFQQNHEGVGYRIMRPARLTHFSANELTHVIAQMGKFTRKNLPEETLFVGDLSREKGGKLGSHKSHQNGMDADVAFYFTNKSFQGYFASAVTIDKPHAQWNAEAQWSLFKDVVQTKYIDRIFIHKVLKKALCEIAIKNGELQKDKNEGLAYETLRRLIPDTDHHNHFHLRVKCSSAQVRCRQMADPAPGSGCF